MPFLFQAYRKLDHVSACCCSACSSFRRSHRLDFLRAGAQLPSDRRIIITLAGISWVVLARPNEKSENIRKATGRGILFGTLAAIGQATGLVFSQQG